MSPDKFFYISSALLCIFTAVFVFIEVGFIPALIIGGIFFANLVAMIAVAYYYDNG